MTLALEINISSAAENRNSRQLRLPCLNLKSSSGFVELFSFKFSSQPLLFYFHSEYKQFDGEKKYCNFSCNTRLLRAGTINREKNCNLRLRINYLNISITVLKYKSIYCETHKLCNFHRKFRFILLLVFSEKAPKVHAHFREAK